MVPTEACYGGRDIRLKWHQLRQAAEDPPFLRRNLRAGLAAGASIEVDIRMLACGNFVCLHEPGLEAETTGRGPVAAADAAAIRRLQMQGSGEPPLLLDELIGLERSGPTRAGARLQLDLCSAVEPGAEAALAEALGGDGAGFILSGYDWHTVARLGASVAGLALGYDPTEDAAAGDADVLSLVRETAPEADTIYLHRGLVSGAVAGGNSLVRRLQASGHRVDCWTIDFGLPDAMRIFRDAAAAGCDEVTTNTPAAWAQVFSAA